MTDPVSIRPFAPGDETDIRRICVQTALLGKPISTAFNDPELVADTLIACYYSLEPESCFVAVSEDRVMGYLAGCLNSTTFNRACRRRMTGHLLKGLILHGHLFRVARWRFARFALRYGLTVERLRKPFIADYPAHLHINLDSAARGQGAGSALVAAFLAYAGRSRSPGIHLTTASPEAKRFFRKAGFYIVAEAPFQAYLPNDVQTLSLLVRDLP